MNTHHSAARPPAIRSAITNRPHTLYGVDGRTLSARRYRDICISLADDLGGQNKLGEPERILIRQVAALTVQTESLQSKIVAGEDVDTEQLVRLANVQGRTLARLGLKKPAAETQPSALQAFLASAAAQRVEDDA